MNIARCCVRRMPRFRGWNLKKVFGFMLLWTLGLMVYNVYTVTMLDETHDDAQASVSFIESETESTNHHRNQSTTNQQPINKQSVARIIMDNDPARKDLIQCFSVAFNFTANNWYSRKTAIALTRNVVNESHPILCDIHGVGKFQIISRISRVCALKSLDEEDYGTEYFMKHSVGMHEFEVMDFLSRFENSRHSTATVHPRYPYLSWNMTHNRTVSAVFSKRLIGPELSHYYYNASEWTVDTLISSMMQCWTDIENLRKILWKYQDGHYVHDDIHSGQVFVTHDDGVQHCNVIDFGMMQSIDHISRPRHTWTSPMSWNVLSKPAMLKKYTQEHGIDALLEVGWRWKSIQWASIVIVDPMVHFLNQKHGGWVSFPGCGFRCERAQENNVVEAMWCSIENRTETLIETVDKMAEQKQDESSEIESYLHLLREYFANVAMDLKEAKMTCSE